MRYKYNDLRDLALDVLDYLESKRISEVTKFSIPDDSDYRHIQAVIAKYVGFETRAQWCEILDNDADSLKSKMCVTLAGNVR